MFNLQKAILIILTVLGLQSIGYTMENTAAILRSGLPNEDPAIISSLSDNLIKAGYTVKEIDSNALCDPVELSVDLIDLLLIPDSSSLPAKSAPTIEAYLRGGGDIIAFNTPMWQRALINIDGRWFTKDEYQKEKASTLPAHVVFDFAPGSTDNWQRSSNTMEVATSFGATPDGPAGQRALHVIIPNLTSYDTCGGTGISDPFPGGNTLTVFSAKGDENTNQLAVEWTEKDGSRWIATVALTPEWRQYILTPDDFKYWLSVPNRGGRGDHFRPENAVAATFGLAHTHTTAVGSGRFEYWVGPFGTAPMSSEYAEVLDATVPPALDTLSPGYKLFDVHDTAKLIVRKDQAVIPEQDIPMPGIIRSPQPRPGGGGFDKGRDWRWIPLVEARSAKGEWRGTPVTLMVHASGPYKGGAWASFGIGDMDWYKTLAAQDMIRSIAEKMNDGVFFVDAGTQFYTYFEDQEVIPGARVVNLGKEPRSIDVTVELRDKQGSLQRLGSFFDIDSDTWPVIGTNEEWKSPTLSKWKLGPWPDDGCVVTATLKDNGKVIDQVSHEVNMWEPKDEKHFVSIKDGEFILDGKPWKPCGVNYMPSSGIGTEDGEYFEHYLSARSYDPEIFQRDIEHIKDLGYNAVSIFIYTNHEKAQNLNDLLLRLDRLGIKANVSLRPGTPMDFLWPQIGDIIKNARLMDNHTVFAYDLAWEPTYGHQRDRVIWDGEWEKWIVERYGSIDNAEKNWGFPVPRDENDKITNPTPEQIDVSGEWNRMSAAYRRFLDTLLYEKYSRARRLVRSVDPNHLVSFRMSEATNPTYRWEGRITYDFPYLAAAVDFLAPEAYGRIGDWERVKPGWFQRTYAEYCAPDKPMIWAEQGCSVWDISRMQGSEARLEYQANHYQAFYEMMIKSGANGIFSWWYPGGFRVGENSDFGIINPDGTDRAVTKVIREYAPLFINAPTPKASDFQIKIDRDEHPDGISGIYAKVGPKFWKAIEKGFTPRLVTSGTGTDSTNCPMIAVGNTPCNGTNPPKYLDAFFDVVEVQDASGNWVVVEKGSSVRVASDKPVKARIQLTNLAEAEWLAGDGNGAVCITSSGIETPLPSNVPHLGSVEVKDVTLAPKGLNASKEITISLSAKGRTPFGEKFAIRLIPIGG